MSTREHIDHFAGKAVVDYAPETGIEDPVGKIYRLSDNYSNENIIDQLAAFFADPRVSEISGIVIGSWHYNYRDSSQVVEALVSARDKLPHLKAIFLGDIIDEECEISWIEQGDISPLLAAYPQLEYLQVRAGGTHIRGEGLSLGSLWHENLKSLVVETANLSVDVVHEICRAHLSALEHLELWLGADYYGGIISVNDLQPILWEQLFPKLRYLGLCNSEITDAIAIAVVAAPIIQQLKVLDLSLGSLGDQGAEALLASPAVAQLEKLDIHHHFVSDKVVTKLKQLGITVDADEYQGYQGNDYRYPRYVATWE